MDIVPSPTQRRCVVYQAGALSHATSGNWIAVTFDTERTDPEGWHAANGSSITIPETGYYLVSASVTFAANATGSRGLRICTSGGTVIHGGEYASGTTASFDHPITTSKVSFFTAADAIEVYCRQSSGGSLAYTIGEPYMSFSVVKL